MMWSYIVRSGVFAAIWVLLVGQKTPALFYATDFVEINDRIVSIVSNLGSI